VIYDETEHSFTALIDRLVFKTGNAAVLFGLGRPNFDHFDFAM